LIEDSNFDYWKRGIQIIVFECDSEPVINFTSSSVSELNLFSYCKDTKKFDAYVIQKQGPLLLPTRSQ